MTNADIIKNKLTALKNNVKNHPTMKNAQATMGALLLNDRITDCNMDEYDQLGLDNNVYDKEASEDQAQDHINSDDDSVYKKEDTEILHNVENSKCNYFIDCEPVDAEDVVDFIDGLIDNEIGKNTYGQLEDEADFDFNSAKKSVLEDN